ncbi:DgyrCDS10620 [Dimorphilus gyrociliatus]|uniref:DgyrCDS10620 n=1 Tax=Dimorphilus gyrociliatus TaxID=2664684 RepID=A0A7I8W3B2_9ANNE|nr:DgyrCDS10620 [Dimorphilus gyrociliatus]
MGLMYLCSYVMIGHYFNKWRAFATGFSSCGSGVGTFVFAPLSAYLIEQFGWRGALLIHAGITLQGCVIGMTFRSVNELTTNADGTNEKNKGKKRTIDFKLLLNIPFMLFCISSFLCAIGFFVPSTYLPDYAISKGISRRKSAFLLSLFGIFNTLGRIVCGLISDNSKVDPLQIYYLALIAGGCTTMFVSFMVAYWQLCIYAAIYGITIAIYVSLCAIIIIDLLGLEKLSNAFGFLNMFRGFSTFIGVPTAGALYDISGNYRLAFYVAGGAIAASGLICIPLKCCLRWREEKRKLKAINKIVVVDEETSLLKKKSPELTSRITTC